MARGRFRSFRKRPKEAGESRRRRRSHGLLKRDEKRGKKEGKKKTKKAASQGKQINSSVGWSRVFSGLAPNICFARPPIPAEEYTSTAYLQKSRELATKLPPPSQQPTPLVSIFQCVCVTPFPFDGTVVAAVPRIRWQLVHHDCYYSERISTAIRASRLIPVSRMETSATFSNSSEASFMPDSYDRPRRLL